MGSIPREWRFWLCQHKLPRWSALTTDLLMDWRNIAYWCKFRTSVGIQRLSWWRFSCNTVMLNNSHNGDLLVVNGLYEYLHKIYIRQSFEATVISGECQNVKCKGHVTEQAVSLIWSIWWSLRIRFHIIKIYLYPSRLRVTPTGHFRWISECQMSMLSYASLLDSLSNIHSDLNLQMCKGKKEVNRRQFLIFLSSRCSSDIK